MAEKLEPIIASLKSVFDSKMQGGSAAALAGGKNSGDMIMSTLDKLAKDLAVGSTDVTTHFKKVFTSLASADVSGAVDGVVGLVKTAHTLIKNAVSATITTAGTTLATAFAANTYVSQKIAGIMSNGLMGSTQAFTSTINQALQIAAKALPPGLQPAIANMGTMISQLLNTATQAFLIQYQDYEVLQKVRQKSRAQTGEGAAGDKAANEARAAVQSRFGMLGREEAAQWGNALMDQGARVTDSTMDNMIRVGKTMGMDAAAMGPTFDRFLVLSSNVEEAGKMMKDSFRAMQAAVGDTNIPVQKLSKFVNDAAVQARFMNVDLKSVNTTMQFLTANADKFSAAGVSVRENGGQMLKELTSGAGKWDDALHAFLGTKGGTSGSPIEGILRSKMGSGFASTVQSTAGGGFTGAKATDQGIVAERLGTMKEAMIEASKGAKTAQEKFYIQQKMATDVFKLGDDAAKAMAMSSKDDMKSLAENPKLADEFKSSQDLQRDLLKTSTIQERIQRQAAATAVQQLKATIDMATFAMVTAAEVAGMEIPDELKDTLKGTFKDTAQSMEEMYNTAKSGLKSIGYDKIMPSIDNAINTATTLAGGRKYKNEEGDDEEETGKDKHTEKGKYTGGNVYKHAATGANLLGADLTRVGERESELWRAGKEQFLIPGADGRVFNHNETMDMMKNNMPTTIDTSTSRGAGPSGGNQTKIEITINAGTVVDKKNIAELMENAFLEAMA